MLNITNHLNDNDKLAFTATCKALAWFRTAILDRLLPLPENLDVPWSWLWGRRYNLGPPPPPTRAIITLYKCPRVENARVKCVLSCRLWMNATMSIEHMEAFRLINQKHDDRCYAQYYTKKVKEFINEKELKRKLEEDENNIKRMHEAAKRQCKMSYILRRFNDV